jgi:hypothetical protein
MKYRVTALMHPNKKGYKEGDIGEWEGEFAEGLLKKGWVEPIEPIEPLPMDEAKKDKQMRSYKRKEK